MKTLLNKNLDLIGTGRGISVLMVLDLSKNGLEWRSLSQGFPSELMWLSVSESNIQAVDCSLVLLTLGWLDRVPSLDGFTALHCNLTSYLDAGFNQLVKLKSNSFPAAVETLLLNDNRISEVAPCAFFHLTRLAKADLSVNGISSLTESSLRLSADSLAPPSFSLGGSPIACDCCMQWFQSIGREAKLANCPHITDLESICWPLMNAPTRTFIPLVEAGPDRFLCEYDTHCFSAGVASLTPATAR